MRLFGRALQVTAYRAKIDTYFGNPLPNATVIRDLRVQFNVTKSLGSEPNKCDIVITNLAPRSRADLVRQPITYQLDAGYDGAARHIFTGDLRYGRSEPDGTEWHTKLQLADGDRAFRFGHVNRSYKAGTSVLTALRDAAAGMGLVLPQGAEASPELQAQFASGVALYGPARDEITRLLAPYGYRWSIQNGRMQILRDNEVRADRAWPISVDNGMVGTPQWSTPSKPGETPKLTVQTLLYPELTPGGKVQIASKQTSGTLRIESVAHAGDTHGDEWFTTIECKSV